MSRPNILFPLFVSPAALEGVGPKLCKLLEKLDIYKIRDLLWLPPVNIIDRRYSPSLGSASDGQVATLTVTIDKHIPNTRRGQPYKILAQDGTGKIEIALFNMKQEYVERTLPLHSTRIVSGKLERYRDTLQMANPDYILSPDERDSLPGLEPVYPLTAGLTNKRMRSMMLEAQRKVMDLPEWCDTAYLKQEKMPGWKAAILGQHNPQTGADIEPTSPLRRRLAYDELLANQLAIALVRQYRPKHTGLARIGDGRLRAKLIAQLPYQLTGSQSNAVAEITEDLKSPEQMLRLLQGDVGAGKTLVALLAMLAVIEAEYQATLMVPTEILARQHYANIGKLCAAIGVNCALLTGREKGKVREAILDEVKNGTTSILIGTHALFQDGVDFSRLGLAVVDEQHRFGVHQRLEISRKGDVVDMLVMTATPIPRTLLLTAYGDMAVSKLTEKPPGRTPITTRIMSLTRYDEVVEGIGRAIAKGARVYWVCPLVEDSEDSDLAAATTRHTELNTRFKGQASLIHGRMKGTEKDAAMESFSSGQTSILVATTVIEVGVDVPEATVMVIEHAERFGLAQLHQLRGRVGRSDAASTCLLLYAEPLGETATARLKIMRETEDGFKIAEEDLRLRGAGELLGTRQSGLPEFKQANLAFHNDLLLAARDDCRLIMERDPQLESERGLALRILLHLYERHQAASYIRSG